MRRGSFIVLLSILFAGCAPSHSAWVSSRDAWFGTSFDSHVYKICSRTSNTCAGSFWSPGNSNKNFDRILEEFGGTRYYITWIRDCQYSVLVSPEKTIISWRYETGNQKNCYGF